MTTNFCVDVYIKDCLNCKDVGTQYQICLFVVKGCTNTNKQTTACNNHYFLQASLITTTSCICYVNED